jgi:hypothetical protein
MVPLLWKPIDVALAPSVLYKSMFLRGERGEEWARGWRGSAQCFTYVLTGAEFQCSPVRIYWGNMFYFPRVSVYFLGSFHEDVGALWNSPWPAPFIFFAARRTPLFSLASYSGHPGLYILDPRTCCFVLGPPCFSSTAPTKHWSDI